MVWDGIKYNLAADLNHGVVYHYFQVEDAPIFMWTGLRDKNGKDIYEGDVLYLPEDIKEGEPEQYAHVWLAHGGFVVSLNHKYSETSYELLRSPYYKSEVVGNIMENPNLMP